MTFDPKTDLTGRPVSVFFQVFNVLVHQALSAPQSRFKSCWTTGGQVQGMNQPIS